MLKDGDKGFHVLVPAAGNGSRTGLSVPKQYCKAGGKSVLRHTLEKLTKIQGLKSLRVIIDPHHDDLYRDAVEGLDLPPPVHGAATRKQSVYNGLKALGDIAPDSLVLIHDAARPFVSPDAVAALLDAMKNHNAATLAAPIADTLVDFDYNRIDRDSVRAVQTPQAFRYSVLMTAHERFRDNENFTDDAGLAAALGEKVALVRGSHDNFKITSAEDLAMAEKLLSLARETRTGFGYDVHAFDPAPATATRLGGVDVPHDRKLLGHSDADVVLHALTDALLGTIGSADIGQLFPPSDNAWKNADSEIFVKEAVRRVLEQGGRIVNADITLIAEEPKVGPHREKMQSRIAGMLGIAPDRVGIKATTSEKLGFVGRGEGIVAQAVATVSFPCGDTGAA